MVALSRKNYAVFPYLLQGINATVYLYRDRLIIRRKGTICQLRPTYAASEQEIDLHYVRHIEANNHILAVMLRDKDPIYVLFAPQDESLARQMVHFVQDTLAHHNHHATRR